jgi:hypothetical protein
MGRKNRKGRTQGENPRRFYRPKDEQGRHRKRRREISPSIDDLPPGAARPPPTGHTAALDDPRGLSMGSLPRPGDWDQHELRTVAAAARTCGGCAEWSSRGGMMGALDRGECLHPGSGFSYPPSGMEACAFFR